MTGDNSRNYKKNQSVSDYRSVNLENILVFKTCKIHNPTDPLSPHSVYLQLNQHYTRLERDYPEFSKKEIVDPGFHEEVLDLEKFWKDVGISRWPKVFRRKNKKAN
jgi:hypothetical protein